MYVRMYIHTYVMDCVLHVCILWSYSVTPLCYGQIDAGSRTLITGFGDGVVRVLVMEDSDPRQVSAGRRLSPKLVLGHVCKPHSKTVTALAVDPSGELLATGVSTMYCTAHTYTRTHTHTHI